MFAPALDGPSLAIRDDAGRTAADLKALGGRDAESYPAFAAALARIGAALAPLLSMTPPEHRGARAAATCGTCSSWASGCAGSASRTPTGSCAGDPWRWPTSSGEWFDSELLRAVIAARGIYASFAGPRSAGTSAGLLLQAALDGQATAPAPVPQGRHGRADRRRWRRPRARRGAEIRTGARVQQILVADGTRHAVWCWTAARRSRRGRWSPAPIRTARSCGCWMPPRWGRSSWARSATTAAWARAAKVNLALTRMPRWKTRFPLGDNVGARRSPGRIHIGPSIDYLERAFDAAKYGEISARPYLDITIPSLLDPELAPAGRAGDVHPRAVRALRPRQRRPRQRPRSRQRSHQRRLSPAEAEAQRRRWPGW